MVEIQQNLPLDKYTTLQVGGPAAHGAVVSTEKELDEVVGYAQAQGLPITVLGGGSNVLVSDAGVSGLVLLMRIADPVQQETQLDGQYVTAGAGMDFDALVSWSVSEGLWGLENLSHIPGSVGATPVQNVGAYGVEVSDLIQQVRVYNLHKRTFEVFTAQECRFGYRDSFFKTEEGKAYVIVSVTYRLSREPQPKLAYKDLATRFAESDTSLAQIRQAVIAIRSEKFPDWTKVGTAGSFFKNPIVTTQEYQELVTQYPQLPAYAVGDTHMKIPLAWVLDNILHLKGTGEHKIEQYQGQALVLMHTGGVLAEEIVAHATQVVSAVYEATGIRVQWEVTKIGF